MLTKLNHVLLAGVVALACSSCQTEKKADYQVIPLPQEVVLTQEKPFLLNKNVSITYPEGNLLLKRNAEFLSGYIRQATGYTPPVKGLKDGETAKHAINLGLDADIANKEGYVLTTTSEGILINGQTENGVFYGCQTLRKSIPAEAQGADILLPAGSIKDEPRFTYRGMHLDVCRHFFPLEFIKEYIDLLALHNMNTFHWHLTDDQGWRIEIKKYPKLTEVGSKRNCTVVGKARSGKYDNIPYGGFYTQEQAKEIVKYAQERYITVIPEVDLPGHMLAALAAYPDMGCTGGPYKDIINKPDLQVYVKDFGENKGDLCLVAQVADEIVGAVWVRIMNDYGHIDNETPSFAISLLKEYRNYGIGTELMKQMLMKLKLEGYKQASLAVQKMNYAVRMYRKVGFEIVDENDEEYIMICKL